MRARESFTECASGANDTSMGTKASFDFLTVPGQQSFD